MANFAQFQIFFNTLMTLFSNLNFMLQKQIWSRDHSNVMALMLAKYETPFLYYMTNFHPFGTICLA